ncbi:hypothetical protein ALO95_102094 [Pseudomonas syringae pv. antirrhini]|uniref:Uncharacterized protein n=1 Tax=Pseudomonas syringae pv. antirrhini TaxID=251702 RepID=A0A0P9P947_9PSED|nr:hypothetical protein ALO88_102481 [Pseudomonas syringae pv. antirrhini]RMP39066.1 hypothetical protein ALQ24_102574 [Pseudomonas syringae pv. antirrhini]RMP39721.1 hypothetical protein ALQ23_102281 [Pseudomonas syringae pv. antirrhini]RMW30372.1 hypothetical protein ALO95_102094 [Pseudomonas syringae pv. antirrhini]
MADDGMQAFELSDDRACRSICKIVGYRLQKIFIYFQPRKKNPQTSFRRTPNGHS